MVVSTPFLVKQLGSVESLSSLSPLTCPIKKCFGIQCPTCGLTRSIVASFNFDFSKANHYHFLGPILFFVIALYWVASVFQKEKLLRDVGQSLYTSSLFQPVTVIAILVYTIWGFVFRNLT